MSSVCVSVLCIFFNSKRFGLFILNMNDILIRQFWDNLDKHIDLIYLFCVNGFSAFGNYIVSKENHRLLRKNKTTKSGFQAPVLTYCPAAGCEKNELSVSAGASFWEQKTPSDVTFTLKTLEPNSIKFVFPITLCVF